MLLKILIILTVTCVITIPILRLKHNSNGETFGYVALFLIVFFGWFMMGLLFTDTIQINELLPNEYEHAKTSEYLLVSSQHTNAKPLLSENAYFHENVGDTSKVIVYVAEKFNIYGGRLKPHAIKMKKKLD